MAQTFVRVYAAYEERCRRSGLVDFAELLLRTHEVLRQQPALLAHYQQRFGQILVDEFQDTNAIQYAMIRVLAGERGQVFVVGDDDQAIYGRSEEHTSELQSLMRNSYAVFCLKKKKN